MQQTVFIGAGAGFAGDRTDAAGPVAEALARSDGPRFLIFETLAERTLALAQVERRRDPARGYNPLLEAFVGPVLRTCLENKIRIVSNFGAANPQGAAMRICEMGRAAGLPRHPGRRRRGRRPHRRAVAAGVCGARDRRLASRRRAGDRRRERLSRRRPDRRGPQPRRRRRRHRPRRRSVAGARSTHPRLRLGGGRLGPARRRHARRPPPRMRGAGDRRLLRRSRRQGRAGHGRDRLSDRRGRRRTGASSSPSPTAPAASSTAAP